MQTRALFMECPAVRGKYAQSRRAGDGAAGKRGHPDDAPGPCAVDVNDIRSLAQKKAKRFPPPRDIGKHHDITPEMGNAPCLDSRGPKTFKKLARSSGGNRNAKPFLRQPRCKVIDVLARSAPDGFSDKEEDFLPFLHVDRL